MNTLNKKTLAVIVIMTITALFSINAKAQSAEFVESTLARFLVAQSQQMGTEMNKQVQESVAQQLKELTNKLTFEVIEVKNDRNITVSTDNTVPQNKTKLSAE